MQIPFFKSESLQFELYQSRLKAILDPIIALPIINGLLLKNIALINGVTIVNHKLAKQMTGWIIVDQDAKANIYRSQPLSDKTLTLTSDAACNVSLWVF